MSAAKRVVVGASPLLTNGSLCRQQDLEMRELQVAVLSEYALPQLVLCSD